MACSKKDYVAIAKIFDSYMCDHAQGFGARLRGDSKCERFTWVPQ